MFQTSPQSAPTVDDGVKLWRAKKACTNCRQKKRACGQTRPCERCVRLGIGHTCIDADPISRAGSSSVATPSTPFVASDYVESTAVPFESLSVKRPRIEPTPIQVAPPPPPISLPTSTPVYLPEPPSILPPLNILFSAGKSPFSLPPILPHHLDDGPSPPSSPPSRSCSSPTRSDSGQSHFSISDFFNDQDLGGMMGIGPWGLDFAAAGGGGQRSAELLKPVAAEMMAKMTAFPAPMPVSIHSLLGEILKPPASVGWSPSSANLTKALMSNVSHVFYGADGQELALSDLEKTLPPLNDKLKRVDEKLIQRMANPAGLGDVEALMATLNSFQTSHEQLSEILNFVSKAPPTSVVVVVAPTHCAVLFSNVATPRIFPLSRFIKYSTHEVLTAAVKGTRIGMMHPQVRRYSAKLIGFLPAKNSMFLFEEDATFLRDSEGVPEYVLRTVAGRPMMF